jgi:hypothetical protein
LKDAVEWDSAEILRKNQFAVDSRDANLHMLYNRVLKNPSIENNLALQKEINERMRID